ncbi:hypothetical protein JOC36_000339 [Weissella uvarum]|uniref:SAM-dependent methyltransferase n=1 Tax=Weissella uvarum TaxID=1479233 RepID=UPI0019621C33|nr:SAM-dependent methyltransferase [Weissella uvarum]MBM7616806.1 hypothetical protein [Weissella uvarum]MCM0594742.1 SAM-dependent methyltransferase [Weissella uvarum]
MSAETLSFGPGRQLMYIDYLDALADFLMLYQSIPGIKHKLERAYQAVALINQGQFPPTLFDMALTEADITEVETYVLNKYPTQADQGNALWTKLREPLEQVDYCLRNIRDEFIEDFNMYAYLTPKFLKAVSAYLAGRPTLELMAGQGYLSAGLKALNPDQTIITTDNQDWLNQPVTAVEPVIPVENLDAMTALERYGRQVEVVLLSWAPDTSDIDVKILAAMRGNYPEVEFLVIGEQDGATNSSQFWQVAKLTELTTLNQTRPQFDLIDEKIYQVK